jgi:transcriptional regulator with XRE-family HTH domain
MTISESIRKAREAKGLTRQKLSEKSGVSAQTIYMWEHEGVSPTILPLICVADVLDVSLDELVGRKTERSNR